MAQSLEHGRLDWVDVAKGICIILVVMMHSTLGVEKAIGAETLGACLHRVGAAFPHARLLPHLRAVPGRAHRPAWRAYLDTKVVHFAYFYVLWVNIQFAMKAPGMVAERARRLARSYLMSYISRSERCGSSICWRSSSSPPSSCAACRRWSSSRAPPLLHVLAPHTGWLVIDEFADRFVFFYTGYAAAPLVLALAARIWGYPTLLLLPALVSWAWLNWLGGRSGSRSRPGPTCRSPMPACGRGRLQRAARPQRMGRRARLLRAQLDRHLPGLRRVHGPDPRPAPEARPALARDVTALAVTAAGVIGALLLFRLVRNTPARFLFVRPDAFKLATPATKRGWPRAEQASLGA